MKLKIFHNFFLYKNISIKEDMATQSLNIVQFAEEYTKLTVVKLKEECKKKNIKIPIKSTKQSIIDLLFNYNPTNDINNFTIVKLKEECAKRNIKNCSRLKKEDLIKLLNDPNSNVSSVNDTNSNVQDENIEEKTIDTMNLPELKAECKKRNIKNFSKLKKEQLVILLTTGELPVVEEKSDNVESSNSEGENTEEKTIDTMNLTELKAECKKRNIKNFSKLKKDQLVTLLTTGELPANVETAANVETIANAEIVANAANAETVEKTINEMTLLELKAECKKRNIKNFSKLKKDDILNLLNGNVVSVSE